MKQKIKYAIEHGVQNALQLFRLLPLQNRSEEHTSELQSR